MAWSQPREAKRGAGSRQLNKLRNCSQVWHMCPAQVQMRKLCAKPCPPLCRVELFLFTKCQRTRRSVSSLTLAAGCSACDPSIVLRIEGFPVSGMVLVEIWESLHSRCAAHRYSVAHIAISQVLMNHQLVQTKPACFRTMARCTTCTVAVQRHPQTKAFLCDNGARRLRYIYIARLSAYSLTIAIGDRPLVKERSVPTTNQTESKVPKWLR